MDDWTKASLITITHDLHQHRDKEFWSSTSSFHRKHQKKNWTSYKYLQQIYKREAFLKGLQEESAGGFLSAVAARGLLSWNMINMFPRVQANRCAAKGFWYKGRAQGQSTAWHEVQTHSRSEPSSVMRQQVWSSQSPALSMLSRERALLLRSSLTPAAVCGSAPTRCTNHHVICYAFGWGEESCYHVTFVSALIFSAVNQAKVNAAAELHYFCFWSNYSQTAKVSIKHLSCEDPADRKSKEGELQVQVQQSSVLSCNGF